jgi:hypothetical protein
VIARLLLLLEDAVETVINAAVDVIVREWIEAKE